MLDQPEAPVGDVQIAAGPGSRHLDQPAVEEHGRIAVVAQSQHDALGGVGALLIAEGCRQTHRAGPERALVHPVDAAVEPIIVGRLLPGLGVGTLRGARRPSRRDAGRIRQGIVGPAGIGAAVARHFVEVPQAGGVLVGLQKPGRCGIDPPRGRRDPQLIHQRRQWRGLVLRHVAANEQLQILGPRLFRGLFHRGPFGGSGQPYRSPCDLASVQVERGDTAVACQSHVMPRVVGDPHEALDLPRLARRQRRRRDALARACCRLPSARRRGPARWLPADETAASSRWAACTTARR